MTSPRDLYYVAVKVFLEKDGKLFIFKDKYGSWDLPGGRIRKDEFETPLEDVIKRKMREELGNEIEYTIGKPAVFFRHERNEADLNGEKIHIFGIGYASTFTRGDIALSELHMEMEWVDMVTFRPEKYFTGGWLKGVEEYLRLQRANGLDFQGK